jgi:hypothetical protein
VTLGARAITARRGRVEVAPPLVIELDVEVEAASVR